MDLAVHARRRVIERFFAWTDRRRRLSSDVEAATDLAEALHAASTVPLLGRLAR